METVRQNSPQQVYTPVNEGVLVIPKIVVEFPQISKGTVP